MKEADHRALARWAAACAAHVLPRFEAHRPGDARPRQAIAALRGWLRGSRSVSAVRAAAFASHAAARDANEPRARAAARAAAHAAATAHVASHARHAASYAAKAATFPTRERAWQLRRLPAAR